MPACLLWSTLVTPRVGAGDVLVRVRAAGINPGEAKTRSGALHELLARHLSF
jgi:NADPH:quinone reductase-like Zn-dependent oxidoreductase